MNVIKIAIIGCVSVGMFWTILIPDISIASNLGIAVDKKEVVFDIDEGESKEFVIGVKNISKKRREVLVSSSDYQLEDNNELVLGNNVRNGIKEWISTEGKNVFLGPGESQVVKFTMKTPKTVALGSHYGAVFFRVIESNDGQVNVSGQLGVHVLVNVNGKTNAAGKLNYFKVPFFSKGIVGYSSEFENIGNVHYVPVGKIRIRNIFTNFQETYEYNKHFVFPGKKFLFFDKKILPSSFGIYLVKAVFTDGENNIYSKKGIIFGYLSPLIFVCSGMFFWALYQNRFRKEFRKNKRKSRIIKNKKDRKPSVR